MRKKKPGRPKTNPTSIHLTLVPTQLARLDAFIADQEEELSRAEAVRRLLDGALPPLPNRSAESELEAAKPRRPGKRRDEL
jgi:hypothetical protein